MAAVARRITGGARMDESDAERFMEFTIELDQHSVERLKAPI